MKRLFPALLASACLASCAASVVSSNPRSVTIKARTTMSAEAQALADAECAKSHRYAVLSIPPGGEQPMNYVYACVE